MLPIRTTVHLTAKTPHHVQVQSERSGTACTIMSETRTSNNSLVVLAAVMETALILLSPSISTNCVPKQFQRAHNHCDAMFYIQ